MEIADRALSTTITMSISGDELVEKHAVCTLANLCEMVELHDKILKEEGLAPILSLAKSADIRTKGEACRALANLAANADIQKHLMYVVVVFVLDFLTLCSTSASTLVSF